MENQSTSSAAWSGGSRILVGILSLAVAGVVAAAVVTKGGRTVEATIPAGTSVVGALDHTISTENSDAGQPVALKTTEPMQLSAGTLPAGAVLHGEVTHVKGGGRIAGAPELTLRFTRLEVNGNDYPGSRINQGHRHRCGGGCGSRNRRRRRYQRRPDRIARRPAPEGEAGGGGEGEVRGGEDVVGGRAVGR